MNTPTLCPTDDLLETPPAVHDPGVLRKRRRKRKLPELVNRRDQSARVSNKPYQADFARTLQKAEAADNRKRELERQQRKAREEYLEVFARPTLGFD